MECLVCAEKLMDRQLNLPTGSKNSKIRKRIKKKTSWLRSLLQSG